jgi:hypothetical protein
MNVTVSIRKTKVAMIHSELCQNPIGHRQIPLLLSSMAYAVSKKPIAKAAAFA